MARGWESKAVEDQIEQARVKYDPGESVDTPASLERKHKLDGLRLMRSQLTGQLRNARTVTQRQMLHHGLQAIEAEIASLEAER